jgi:hypothetical protein
VCGGLVGHPLDRPGVSSSKKWSLSAVPNTFDSSPRQTLKPFIGLHTGAVPRGGPTLRMKPCRFAILTLCTGESPTRPVLALEHGAAKAAKTTESIVKIRSTKSRNSCGAVHSTIPARSLMPLETPDELDGLFTWR